MYTTQSENQLQEHLWEFTLMTQQNLMLLAWKKNTTLSPYIHSFIWDLEKNYINYGTDLLLYTRIPLLILHFHVFNIQ